jgi:hypothetical protein
LTEGVLQVALARLGSHIEKSHRDRRDRDASMLGRVPGIEGARAVQADPGTPVLDAGAVTSGRGAS